MSEKERTVALEEARELAKSKQGHKYSIHWRPNPRLPEAEQYCIVKDI
jgi:hypothetical protein